MNEKRIFLNLGDDTWVPVDLITEVYKYIFENGECIRIGTAVNWYCVLPEHYDLVRRQLRALGVPMEEDERE